MASLGYKIGGNIGALIIRMGFWGPLYYNSNKAQNGSIRDIIQALTLGLVQVFGPARRLGVDAAVNTLLTHLDTSGNRHIHRKIEDSAGVEPVFYRV